jgi:DNA-binding NarL/FixJ family response regulator
LIVSDYQPTILVVDDDPVILSSVADILRVAGYNSLMAKSGLEALHILEQEAPDLMIIDIMMPGMDGYQLYQRIRRDPTLNPVPAIFLTAKGAPEDVRLGKEMGIDDYLVKPFEPEDLLASIHGKLARFQQLTGLRPPPADRETNPMPPLGEDLTPREREVLALMVEGCINSEIAERLVVSLYTIKNHVCSILSKLGVRNRVEAVKIAVEYGLVQTR